MTFLAELWLPILVASVVCFILSSIAWTVLPHHRKDFKAVADHDALETKLKELGLSPGVYMFPMTEDQAQMRSPEFQALYSKGPWGTITLWGAKPSMGKNLIMTFAFFLVVSFLIAYVSFHAIGLSNDPWKVFQMTGTIGILSYCASSILGTIWFTVPLRNKITNFADGLAYGLATGAAFAMMWPSPI